MSFLNDVGQVPFSYTGGATGTVAFSTLFFEFSPLDASSSPSLFVELLLTEAPQGFSLPQFDALDINGQRVNGTLTNAARDPLLFSGGVDWVSNPNFDPANISSFGFLFGLESNSDASVTFDSVQFSGVPEPGAATFLVGGLFLLALRRNPRQKSVITDN